MVWIKPVLNWSNNDTYEAEDLNRVENNTEYINDLLAQYGYKSGIISILKNRNIESYDDIESINRVESNLDNLRNCFCTPEGWQARKTWIANMKFDYSDAYRYENNLNLLFDLANKMIGSFKYCGMYVCGSKRLPIQIKH